jgi:hypothetical protein
MFDKATGMVQKHMPAGQYPDWVPIVVLLVIAWIIFMVIREIWCWYWKTSAIASELWQINNTVHCVAVLCAKCNVELSKANSKLERIAESACASGKGPPGTSGG